MASIQNITHQPTSARVNEQSQKRSSEGNRQLQNSGSKNAPSFQELLGKPDNQDQAVTEKAGDRSDEQRDEQAGGDSKASSGDISRPAPQSVPPTYYLPPTITGTEGNDFLLGTSGTDIIDGKEGNDILLGGRGDDRLIGGEGNDWLLGGHGNDTLVGGQGSDWLLGGSGNDKLDGERGSDRLFGGSGNDTLADEHGNNHIDGGRGFDTFKLGKGIDSYHISVNKQGEFTLQELSRRVDSPRHTVKNIESFQFADMTISAKDLQDRVTNPVQDLSLSKDQKATVESVFNIDNASVRDNDGDGKISAGDAVSGTVFSEINPFKAVSFEVSQDNADHINGALGSELRLSPERLLDVDRVVNPDNNLNNQNPIRGAVPPEFDFQAAGVLDTDKSGGLSEGDVVYSRPNFITTGGDPIAASPAYHRLTADDIQTISNPTAGAIPEVSNEGINPTEGKDVPFTQVGEIVVAKQQLPSYLDKPFEQHIISNQSQLNQLRADLGLPIADRFGGGLPGTELPKVDFNEQVLVYTVADAADPNITQSNFKLSHEGTLSSLVTSTKIGFEASDEAQLTFMAMSREGVEAFANSDPINGKNPGSVIVPPEIDHQEVREALEDNKQKWLDAGLTHYRYTLERSCFCAEEARRPVDNTFDNGELTSVFHDGSEGEVPDSNQLNVKDMFKLIDEALSQGADDIQVEYDSRLGHPTSIYIDYNQSLADEELSLTIRNLHPGLVYEIQDPAPVVSKPPVEIEMPGLPKPDDEVSIESVTGPKGFQPQR